METETFNTNKMKGVMVGRHVDICKFVDNVLFLRKLVERDNNKKNQEQGIVAMSFFMNKRWVGIDYDSELVLFNYNTHHKVLEIRKDNELFRFKAYSNKEVHPFMVHYPAGAKKEILEGMFKNWKLSFDSLNKTRLVFNKKSSLYPKVCDANFGFFK